MAELSFRKSVDKMYDRFRQRRCLVAGCVRHATPGYVLCKRCREKWRGEVRDTTIIQDPHIGALHGFQN